MPDGEGISPDEKRRCAEHVRELLERVEDLENEREAIQKLPQEVARLAGAVDVLRDLVTTRFDKVDEGVSKVSSIRTAINFAAVILVPIMLALIGGYFTLKAGTK